MADIVQIEIEIPKMGYVNIEPEIPEKEEISIDSREKSFIYHDELFHRDLPDQHPMNSISGLQQALNAKQNVISDLETIRSGASKGNTAVQPSELNSAVQDLRRRINNEEEERIIVDNALSDRVDDVEELVSDEENRAKRAEQQIAASIPKDTSDLTNGAGFITIAALSGYATQQWVLNQGFLTIQSLTGYATESWVSAQGYITGITSSDVTTALGYTPYNSNNPDGFITNAGVFYWGE